MRSNRRLLPLVFVALGAAIYFQLSPRLPQDQSLHFILDDIAPRVEELVVRYQAAGGTSPASDRGTHVGDTDTDRLVRFHYAPGSAPRIVSHEPRLANGDYVVQMELGYSSQTAANAAPARVTVERRLTLQGGTTSVDLSRAIPPSPEAR